MTKRVVGVFALVMLMLGLVSLRIYSLSDGDYAAVAGQNQTQTITVANARGTIYDCNGIPLTNSIMYYQAAVIPTQEALAALNQQLTQEELSQIMPRLQSGYPTVIPLQNELIDSPYIKLLQIKQRYTDSQLAPHIIGHLDSGNLNGVMGIEKAYNTWLQAGGGKLSVSYTVDANGRALTGAEPKVNDDNYSSKQGVRLTLDSKIQKLAEEVAKDHFETGAILVVEAKTGKIRAVASIPDFQPTDLGKSLEDPNAPLINRAFSAYSLGSIFKLVVAAAALESGYGEQIPYECTGVTAIDGTSFYCNNHISHGTVDMKSAVAYSCNGYFIDLGQKIGAEKILHMAKQMGFGAVKEVADNMFSDAGNLPTLESITTPAALANLSFGQGELLATPLQVAAMISAIADGGNLHQPTLVEGLIDADGHSVDTPPAKPATPVISASTASLLQNFMIETVNAGYGEGAKPEEGGAGGKTATAQSGWIKDGREVYQAWFGGFFPATDPKYSVVVLKEDGKTGSADCAPIFKEMADGIRDLGYLA